MKQPEFDENEIIAEVRRARAEHATKFNYDFKAICQDYRRLTQRLNAQGWKVVSKPARKATEAG